ncbi:sigma-70 family RNA polymerase sigma factor [Pontibacter sp. G13]|uniref:RNA polymerase sigma factor n=1 Tax=Pontibacter sp. G13 TaxID=3074898 RepID=UPI002889CD95|nr:sigma-70 family RNA polymerase sigma factor [Pontibacter sp. G13]WNJ21007.1 sigma-70 family RNA polymerase sigma factor [Pontibacter sp. G13]
MHQQHAKSYQGKSTIFQFHFTFGDLVKDYHTYSDEALIHEITEGGRTHLFSILYDRYSDKVYRKCISFVRDRDVAQDMVQDILIKVFTQLSKFKGNSRFSTWLYSITYNYCVEYYRKNNKVSTVGIEEGPDISDEGDADDLEILALRRDHLQRALDQVAPEDKMILMMKYQDDISIKELMNTLELSESAVKMRLARARKRVKQLIRQSEKPPIRHG